MNGSKQRRTALLAATLAVLVSGGVAFQVFAEAPVGLRDTRQADYSASLAGGKALSHVVSGWEASTASLMALDTVEPGRFAPGSAGVGTLSNALAGIFSDQAAATAPGVDAGGLLSALDAVSAAQVSLAEPVTGDGLQAAMRTSEADGAFFASAATLAPALDLSHMVAVLDGDSAGRLSFAPALEAGPLRAAVRSDGASGPLFSHLTAPALDFSSLAAALDNGAARVTFAAQTSEAGALTDGMRTDREDSALFANPFASSSTALDLAGLAAALGGSEAGQATFSDQAADGSGLREAMRSAGTGSALFSGEATARSPLVDIEALAAALGSDSMDQGGFSGLAPASGDLLAAMRSGGTSSALFSNVVAGTAQSVDFASIAAALADNE